MSNLPCNSNKDVKEKCTGTEECWIERPRYFSGQLLTDADLTAEQKYFIEKNKMQNRYLHGWGVVCGLMVKCFPCCTGHGSSGKVLVEPGYAIDCCGNDIIVCNETEFDIVKRMNELKKKKKAESDPCSPRVVVEEKSCTQAEEKYYLTISYKEEDAKPVTALKAKNSCSIQTCILSRTKECFELDLVEYCTLNKKIEDNFITRAKECVTIFSNTWKRVFDEETIKIQEKTPEEIKNFIREYYKAQPSHVRCDVLDVIETTGEEKKLFTTKTGGFEFTEGLVSEHETDYTKKIFANAGHPLTEEAFMSKVDEDNWEISDGFKTYRIEKGAIHSTVFLIQKDGLSKVQLFLIVFYLLLDCICQALINPCPECGEDDSVILATISMKNKKIDRICNFSRKWVMTFPTLFYWIPINQAIGRLMRLICYELDLKIPGRDVRFKTITTPRMTTVSSPHNISTNSGHENPGYGDLPLWMYMIKMVENDFAIPKEMALNSAKILNIVPQSLFNVLDPKNVSLENAINKESSEAEVILKKLKIDVVRTERYELSLKDFTVENIVSMIPVARPGSKVIQLVDKENKVVGFRVVEKEEVSPRIEEIDKLKEEFAEIKANIDIMKTHMRRDTNSVIKARIPIEKSYRLLTTELTRNLISEIPSEALKDVGDVRAGEMKKAKIVSVYDVLEAVPAEVSDAVKEPMANAVKYVDNAEEYTLGVAKLIAEEMKAKEIKKKADLDKLDTEKIADRLKISERKIKDSIDKIK